MTRPLNERERQFVAAYTGPSAGNAAAAAIAAGYSKKAARQIASRLLTKANVKAAIEAVRVADEDESILSRLERKRLWASIARDVTQPPLVRLKASELAGKSEGDFIDKHEHSGPDGGPMRMLAVIDASGKATELSTGIGA